MLINSKPDIPEKILLRWQRLVNLAGQLTDTPAALITRALSQNMQMLVRSDTGAHFYQPGELSPRDCGLYCDAVVNKGQPLLVANAHLDGDWQDNPDIALGLCFYLGYPLHWPDGEAFGTLCVLDNKDNQQAKEYQDLMAEFQQLVNQDLAFVLDAHLASVETQSLQSQLTENAAKITARAENLEEINTAMRLLIEHQNRDSELREQQKHHQLRALIEPWLRKLELSGVNPVQQGYLQNIRQQLSTSDSGKVNLSTLTAMERQVALAIKQGLSSKSIAEKFFLEKSTIDFHRRNIRQKLGLSRKGIGLKQFLLNSH